MGGQLLSVCSDKQFFNELDFKLAGTAVHCLR